MALQMMNCETCGGALDYAADGKSAVCPFCGNEYHFKEEKGEALILALNRANEYRLKNDFDGAITEYKLVTERNPEDSEAYWGLAISTYGIEYVEDPRTKKRIPTCRRTVKESILQNENYLKAIEKAAPEQREVYERRAAAIERLQKAIKRQLEDEEDFDVFISFKSTDEDGSPTKERGVARRIYDELKKRGIKTFFSEITLRDRLGEEFEPIIYKALYSCKFFILVVASEENMNSAWVKNEWSRFRDRVFDENLTGAGCAVFEGIKPGALPAFLRGQGINLAKYPAGGYEIEIADALSAKFGLTHKNDEAEEIRRRIEEQKKAFEEQQRVLEERLRSVTAAVPPAAVPAANATVDSLMKRAAQEAEDGDYEKAASYYNKVLDADPENAEAWLGLFLCENETTDEKGFSVLDDPKTVEDCERFSAANKKLAESFSGKNFRNAVKYAAAGAREEYETARETVLQSVKEAQEKLEIAKKEIADEDARRERRLALARAGRLGFNVNGTTLIRYTGKEVNVKIPEGITKIGDRAFESTNIASVTIPDSVKSIGKYAFAWCNNLNSVYLGENSQLEEIGERAFSCLSLNTISFSAKTKLKSIGAEAFYGCKFVSFAVPSTVRAIGDRAFYYNYKLQKFELRGNVKLGTAILKKCSSLSEVVIPKSMEPQKYQLTGTGGKFRAFLTAKKNINYVIR